VEKFCEAAQSADDIILRRVRIAYWLTKATNTHQENAMLIVLSLQQ